MQKNYKKPKKSKLLESIEKAMTYYGRYTPDSIDRALNNLMLSE